MIMVCGGDVSLSNLSPMQGFSDGSSATVFLEADDLIILSFFTIQFRNL